jgi:hypothetical protein
MPLASYTPEAPTPVVPNLPKITEQVFAGVVVDTKYTPLSSLLTYIDGASWTVTYYSQILNSDNDIRSQDVELSGIYQQYTEINSMELKVTTPLNSSQETSTNRMVVTGAANVYPFIIPNIGDMFAADAGDGREAIFRVTNSEKKSILKESVYFIEYSIMYYSDSDLVRRQDLKAKTINSYFYIKDFLLNGQNPLLIDEEYSAYQELDNLYHEIVQNYFRWFFNNEYKTLIVPGQTKVIYDHYLVNALLSILNTVDAPQIMHIRKLNVDDDRYLKQPQIWDALVNRDLSLLDLSNKTMGLVSTHTFNANPMLNGIRFSGVQYVVYPVRPEKLLDVGIEFPVKNLSIEKIQKITSRSVRLDKLVGDRELDLKSNFVVNIKPVLKDDRYIFSDSFYTTGEDMSVLEIMTLEYLNKKAINPITLLKVIKNYRNFGVIEQFYYLPVIMILINSTIRKY